MNKPAPKEPSMDEILSSIRQIIADDDAAVAPGRPLATSPQAPAAAVRPMPTMPAPRPMAPEREPLALSPDQIVSDTEVEATDSVTTPSFSDILADDDEREADVGDAPELVDPEDITFEADEEPEPVPQPTPQAFGPAVSPTAPRVSGGGTANPPPRPPEPVAQAAPMPDPTLSRDMAEQLLQPTTEAAVKHTLSRLNGLSMVGSGVTIEDMMRDLLRPMLKEWLDENLPSVVERMVEKEIARLARGE